jgi:hypothetical protein
MALSPPCAGLLDTGHSAGTGSKIETMKINRKLIWSFDIATLGSADITEVAVDALTGEVVAVAKETPAQQEAEKKADAKEKR